MPVFSTSPPPLPSPPSQEVVAQVQPMMTPTTIAGSEEEKKPTEQQDNRVVLMKTEVPGYSAKDIECCINVDRTIEAKRSNGRGVKIGIPNSINVDSIKAYCEHGIFQVLGEPNRPSRRCGRYRRSERRPPRSKKPSNSWKTRWSKKTKKKKTTPCS